MSIYTNVFSYYIWSFKACLTYQLLNSTLFIMDSWNSERVHNVHVGDNAFFFFLFVDGFPVWYPCGIYCKNTTALFLLKKKKCFHRGQHILQLQFCHQLTNFDFCICYLTNYKSFCPSRWASLGLADKRLPVTWQLAERMRGSCRRAESVRLCRWQQQQLNKVKWGGKGKEDSFRTPLSRFSVVLLTNTKTVGK